MLEIKKIPNYKDERVYDFKIIQDDKVLNIFFGGNGDLYFYANKINFDDEEQIVNFEITKENYELYYLFERLYNQIINSEIYRIVEIQLEFYDEDELEEKRKNYQEWNSELKRSSSYTDLVHNGVISWRHDEQIYEEANILNIYKEKEQYRLEFIPKSKELSHYIDIRFRNSGSRYHPFHLPFMELYQSLQEMDLEYHQIHMEEYLYQKKYTKNNNKK